MTLENMNKFQWDRTHNRFYLASEPTLLIQTQQLQKSKSKKKTTQIHRKKQHELSSERWEALLHPWQRNVLLASSLNPPFDEKKKQKKTKKKAKKKTTPEVTATLRRPASFQPRRKSTKGVVNHHHSAISLNIDNDNVNINENKIQDSRNDMGHWVGSMSQIDVAPYHCESDSIHKQNRRSKVDGEISKQNLGKNRTDTAIESSLRFEEDIMWAWSQSQGLNNGTNEIKRSYERNEKSNDASNNPTTHDNASALEEGEEEEWCWEPYHNGLKLISEIATENKKEKYHSNSISIDNKNSIQIDKANTNQDHHPFLYECDEESQQVGSNPNSNIEGVVKEIHTIHYEEKHKLMLALDLEKIRQKATLVKRRQSRTSTKEDTL